MAWHLVTWGNEVEVIEPRKLKSLLNKMMAPKSVLVRLAREGLGPEDSQLAFKSRKGG